MREIKFRAWWKDARLMEEVVTLRDGEISILVPLKPNSLGQNYEHQTLEEGQYVLMQFTGLKDKNGKEIYEGDILLDDTEGEAYDCVEWNVFNGGFDTKYWYSPRELVEHAEGHEVIGNIYENPELLK